MKVYLDGIIYSLQSVGGISRYANELILGLSKSQNDIKVLMHRKFYNKPPISESKLKFVSILPTIFKNTLLKYLSYPADQFITNHLLNKLKITEGVFHSTYYTNYSSIKVPMVITVHDLMHEILPDFNNIKSKLFLIKKRQAIMSADAIICISHNTAKDLLRYYNIDPKKIAIIYNGVSDIFTTKSSSEILAQFLSTHKINAPYFLYVGSRKSYKNFNSFIKAFAAWNKNRDYKLVTVGGGNFTLSELAYIEILGLKNQLISFSHVSDLDLAILYQGATGFVFPSLYEGFGLPLLEAMSMGTVVLASDISVFKEIGKDTPIYFNPNDTDSIIEALDLSLKDNEKRIQAGLIIAKEFSWQKTVAETMNLYKKISV